MTKISTSGHHGDRSESTVVVKGLSRGSKGLGEKQGEVRDCCRGGQGEERHLLALPALLVSEEDWQPDTYRLNLYQSQMMQFRRNRSTHNVVARLSSSS